MESAPPSSSPYDPSVDDVRILLFARCDREKEDWFRRFQAASTQNHIDTAANISPADSAIPHEHEVQFGDMVFVNDEDIVTATTTPIITTTTDTMSSSTTTTTIQTITKSTSAPTTKVEDESQETIESSTAAAAANRNSPTTDGPEKKSRSNSLIDGLIMTPCAHRGPTDYVRFMSRYQVGNLLFSFYFIFQFYFTHYLFIILGIEKKKKK